jgi:hypothetical protein
MKHLKDYALIILAAFVAIFCYRSCNGIKDIQVVESIVHDTITQKVTTTRWKQGKDIPFVIISTDTVHDSVRYLVHDTVQILTDYMRTYAYSDTINVDSNTFVINDTISQNKIQSRGFEAKITEKTILTTITKTPKAKNTLYLGFRGDLSGSNGLEVLSPGIVLNAKNKALIGLNVNINKNFNIGYSGSLYFKIGKK